MNIEKALCFLLRRPRKGEWYHPFFLPFAVAFVAWLRSSPDASEYIKFAIVYSSAVASFLVCQEWNWYVHRNSMLLRVNASVLAGFAISAYYLGAIELYERSLQTIAMVLCFGVASLKWKDSLFVPLAIWATIAIFFMSV